MDHWTRLDLGGDMGFAREYDFPWVLPVIPPPLLLQEIDASTTNTITYILPFCLSRFILLALENVDAMQVKSSRSMLDLSEFAF